ncbi:peptide chain release factor N(5)-glutamine methyltransferase [soil metagenome]
MNVNSQPQTRINDWLLDASRELESVGITSARLDAEIILSHTLNTPRTYLHAHNDDMIDARSEEIANARIALRSDRVPIAYIIGHKDFYDRKFKVTTATLVPRPESEELIEVLSDLLPKNHSLFPNETIRLVDVGTGSGILGITAKLEHPELDVTLLDISAPALKVAQINADRLHADVQTMKSDLLDAYPFRPSIIIANLPYVDKDWERSPETNNEPALALFAADGGKALIKKLVSQASSRLQTRGILILEADPTQHADIIKHAQSEHFSLLKQQGYCLALERD